MSLIFVISLLGGLLTTGDGPKPEDAKKEADALVGTWTFSKMVRDGQDMTDQLGGVKVVFDAEKFSSPNIKAEYKLDPSKSPKAMDISYKEGPAAGQTVKAIYKLEGETLTICRARAEADERPREFEAPAGSHRFLFEFKRSKEATK
jgi:uncharacterized protein (TIGR03067 family)